MRDSVALLSEPEGKNVFVQKPRYVRLLILLSVVVIGCASLRSRTPGKLLSESDFNRIEDGMTLKQVEAIFGCPPGDYSCDRVPFLPASDARIWQGDTTEVWHGTNATIQVLFD